MMRSFFHELIWIFLFLFLLYLGANTPGYSFERLALSKDLTMDVIWILPFVCGVRISWRFGLGAWWFCVAYAILIAIAVLLYNIAIDSLGYPTDFLGVNGFAPLLAIFFVISFIDIFVGFIIGVVLASWCKG